MIKKRLIAYISAATLTLATVLSFSGTAYALSTCNWTGGGDGVSFSDASNWSGCGGAPVPAAGDNLVFSDTTLPSTTTLNNNLSGLTVGSITFSGSGSHGFIIGGNSISIAGGMTDSASGSANAEIDANLTLTAGQSISDASSGDLLVHSPINLNGFTLTLAITNGSSEIDLFGVLSGSGQLTFDGLSGGAQYMLVESSPSLSAPVDIKNDAVVEAVSDNFDAVGTGTITVENGGALVIDSTLASGTFSNNLVLAGDGTPAVTHGALVSCLSDNSQCTDASTTLTFTGTVDLQASTEVVNGAYTGSSTPANTATFDFAGSAVGNGFTLTATGNSNTSINNNPLGSGSTPKAPNTGLGLPPARSLSSLMVGASLIPAAFTLGFFGLRKFAKAYLKRR